MAFLRAVNVAGHASVKMSDVRTAFSKAGAANVATYIQSGNVIFESQANDVRRVVENAKRRLEARLGEAPVVMLRTMRRLGSLLEDSPFKRHEARSTVKYYVAFLAGKPERELSLPVVSDKEALELLKIDGDDAFLVSRQKKNGFFGFPNNFIESELGVAATSRNWSTVTKLVAKAQRV